MQQGGKPYAECRPINRFADAECQRMHAAVGGDVLRAVTCGLPAGSSRQTVEIRQRVVKAEAHHAYAGQHGGETGFQLRGLLFKKYKG